MAKPKYMKPSHWGKFFLYLLAIVVVGGLFTTGVFANFPVLNWLLLISPSAQQILGWGIIIVGAIVGILKYLA